MDSAECTDRYRSGMLLTINKVIVGTNDSLVESSRIGRSLEGEPIPLLARPPMMERGHHFEVLQISINNTT